MALHRVFVARVFIVDFLDVGSEHAHLRLRREALIGEREEHEFDEDCEQQDDDSVVQVHRSQEVEDRDDDASVYPAEH